MGALFGIRLGDVSEAKVDGTVVEIQLKASLPSWSKMDRMSDKRSVLVVKCQTVGASRVLQSHNSNSPCHEPCYGCI